LIQNTKKIKKPTTEPIKQIMQMIPREQFEGFQLYFLGYAKSLKQKKTNFGQADGVKIQISIMNRLTNSTLLKEDSTKQ
jgi:hypothetical protein